MKLRVIIPITIAVLVASLWPISTLSAPDWTVCVVDESNRPVTGVLVRESYQNYSAESDGHEEDLYTDAEGCVRFTPKYVRSALIRRLVVILYSATAGVHASFGSYSFVTAFRGAQSGVDVRGGYLYGWKGSPAQLKSTLVLH
jgi:hypothetical protein